MAFVGLFGSASASAAPITFNQDLFGYLFDPQVGTPSLLMILADMGPAGDALRMALAQVSCDAAESDARLLAADAVSQEDESPDWECETSSSTLSSLWGMNSRAVRGRAAGMPSGGGGGGAAHGAGGGGLQSIVTNPIADNPLAGDSIAQPPNFGGPGFDRPGGSERLSGLETGSSGNGHEAIRSDYLTFVLSITAPENLLAPIQSSDVSVPFDSPTPPVAKVPEPSSFLLTALAIAGFGLMRLRRSRAVVKGLG